MLGFLREPLQDLSISRPHRRLAVGHPAALRRQYVTYVWFDALPQLHLRGRYPDGASRCAALWEHVEHLIGKDILKPHGVYWPTMLKAAGIPLYRRPRARLLVAGGSKMSKSVGNVVEAFQLTDKYGHDAFRYFLLREMNFGLDASFSEEALVDRLNADLANDLGNLASRASTLIAAGGPVAQVTAPVEAADREIATAAAEARATLEQAMEEFAFQKALGGIWAFIGAVNRYVDTSAPWALAQGSREAAAARARALHPRRLARLPRRRAGAVPPGRGRARSARRSGRADRSRSTRRWSGGSRRCRG